MRRVVKPSQVKKPGSGFITPGLVCAGIFFVLLQEHMALWLLLLLSIVIYGAVDGVLGIVPRDYEKVKTERRHVHKDTHE